MDPATISLSTPNRAQASVMQNNMADVRPWGVKRPWTRPPPVYEPEEHEELEEDLGDEAPQSPKRPKFELEEGFADYEEPVEVVKKRPIKKATTKKATPREDPDWSAPNTPKDKKNAGKKGNKLIRTSDFPYKLAVWLGLLNAKKPVATGWLYPFVSQHFPGIRGNSYKNSLREQATKNENLFLKIPVDQVEHIDVGRKVKFNYTIRPGSRPAFMEELRIWIKEKSIYDMGMANPEDFDAILRGEMGEPADENQIYGNYEPVVMRSRYAQNELDRATSSVEEEVQYEECEEDQMPNLQPANPYNQPNVFGEQYVACRGVIQQPIANRQQPIAPRQQQYRIVRPQQQRRQIAQHQPVNLLLPQHSQPQQLFMNVPPTAVNYPDPYNQNAYDNENEEFAEGDAY